MAAQSEGLPYRGNRHGSCVLKQNQDLWLPLNVLRRWEEALSSDGASSPRSLLYHGTRVSRQHPH